MVYKVFKRKFVFVIYIALLAFLSVYLFFKIQERDIIIRLNNNNLSLDAYKVTPKQNSSLAAFSEKVKNASALDDTQIHYQSKKDPRITYFYGKGDYDVPPMISGHFFSNADFDSAVPLLVVGKNYQDKLYQPKDQAYLKLDGQYVPVLGIMGEQYASELDDQIFIAASVATLNELNTSHYRIVLDMTEPLSAKTLKKQLNLATAKSLVNKNFIISHESWLSSHLAQVLGLMAVVVGVLAQMLLWLLASGKRFAEATFLKADKARFIFDEWRTYSLWLLLGLGSGTLFGILYFQMTSYVALISYLLGIAILCSMSFYLLIKARLEKEGK